MKSASLDRCLRTLAQPLISRPVLNVVMATFFAFGSGSVLANDDTPGSPFHFGFLPAVTEPIQQSVGPGEGQTPWQSIGGFNFGYHSEKSGSGPSWHSNVNVTDYQTLMNFGLSTQLLEAGSAIISSQTLGGYSFGRNDFADSWNGSFDLFGAAPLGPSQRHFLKLGAFVDVEEDFGKFGPKLGLFLWADSRHPVTLDLAYGQGFGDSFLHNGSIWSVADDDFQMQAGVFVTERLQLGVTGQYLRWDDLGSVEQDWRTGGFANYFTDKGLSFRVGVAAGEQGTSGFAGLSYQEVPSHISARNSAKNAKAPIRFDHLGSWMTSAVQRQQAVQVRRFSPQANTNANSNADPATDTGPLGTLDTFWTYIGDPAAVLGAPGGTSNITVTYTNTSNTAQTVTIISIEELNGTVANLGVTSSVLAGGATTTTSPGIVFGGGPPPPGPFIQTIVFSVDGRQFSIDVTYPGGVTSGFATPTVTVGP